MLGVFLKLFSEIKQNRIERGTHQQGVYGLLKSFLTCTDVKRKYVFLQQLCLLSCLVNTLVEQLLTMSEQQETSRQHLHSHTPKLCPLPLRFDSGKWDTGWLLLQSHYRSSHLGGFQKEAVQGPSQGILISQPGGVTATEKLVSPQAGR